MANINISFDTESKKCDVTINGSSLSNVKYISIYKDYDDSSKSHISISTEHDAGEGLTVYTSLEASQASKTISKYNDITNAKILDISKEFNDGIVRGAYTLMGKEMPKYH